jgi:hypothetical protein
MTQEDMVAVAGSVGEGQRPDKQCRWTQYERVRAQRWQLGAGGGQLQTSDAQLTAPSMQEVPKP